MQRDRDFDHYQDLEARYDLRPSAWVEPQGAWGPGRVELVEIPTDDEVNDNVAAYWVPDAAARRRARPPALPTTSTGSATSRAGRPGAASRRRASIAGTTPGAS